MEKKDDKNKSITFKALDGEVMKDFKSVISILEVSAKDCWVGLFPSCEGKPKAQTFKAS